MDDHSKRVLKSTILKLRNILERDLSSSLNDAGKFNEFKQLLERNCLLNQSMEQISDKFMRESAFRYLIRLFGLRCMEERGILERCSNVTEQQHQLNAYFNQIFSGIAKDVGGFYEPNEWDLIFTPSNDCLQICVNILNGKPYERLESLPDAIFLESDMLGWVFQYFYSEEKKRVFNELYRNKKKIKGEDIIPATRLYTEPYMVKFLVQNSLGAYWMQMHPDSELHLDWEYYVPQENGRIRPIEPISDISFFDPACGCGNFFLEAFDLLAKMYLEEIARDLAGKIPLEEIPVSIIEKNLYGTDIDSQSIEISRLSLYLKIREFQMSRNLPKRNPQKNHLVPTNESRLEEPQFQELFQGKIPRSGITRVLKALNEHLEGIKEFGTLLRPAEVLLKAIKAESQMGNDETNINIENLNFSSKYLCLLTRKYDIIATNPPYMHTRSMDAKMKRFLMENYPNASHDLYTAFIMKCCQHVKSSGIVSLITQQSFGFIRIYEKFRKWLLDNYSILLFVHLGTRAFKDISGAKTNAAMFCLQPRNDASLDMGTYFKLIFDEDKEQILRMLCKNEDPRAQNRRFHIPLSKLKSIQGWPLAYWMPNSISQAFQDNPRLETHFKFYSGIKTANNNRYLRYFWEMKELGKKWKWYSKGGEFSRFYAHKQYVVDWSPAAQDFYRTQKTASIGRSADNFREGITYTDISSKGFSPRQVLPNCLVDMSGPILLPRTDEYLLYLPLLNSKIISFMLKLLNPTTHFQGGDLLKLPIPKEIPSETILVLIELAKHCINLKKEVLSRDLNGDLFKERNFFVGNSLTEIIQYYTEKSEAIQANLALILGFIDKISYTLYKMPENEQNLVHQDFGFPPGWYPIIENFNQLPLELPVAIRAFYETLPIKELGQKELNALVEKFKSLYEERRYFKRDHPISSGNEFILEDLSEILQINPISIMNIRKNYGCFNRATRNNIVFDYISLIILRLFGFEWFGEESVAEHDINEIIPITSFTGEKDLISRLREELIRIHGRNASTIEEEFEEYVGKSLTDWVNKEFFRYHSSRFKKRPFIWALSSKKGTFACFIHYQKLTINVLEKVRNKNLVSTINHYQKLEDSESELNDLLEFAKKIDKLLKLPFEPILDDGVRVNIAPLQKFGVLQHDVLSKKDLERAIFDRNSWREEDNLQSTKWFK